MFGGFKASGLVRRCSYWVPHGLLRTFSTHAQFASACFCTPCVSPLIALCWSSDCLQLMCTEQLLSSCLWSVLSLQHRCSTHYVHLTAAAFGWPCCVRAAQPVTQGSHTASTSFFARKPQATISLFMLLATSMLRVHDPYCSKPYCTSQICATLRPHSIHMCCTAAQGTHK